MRRQSGNDQHTAPVWRRQQLPRRLRGVCHSQPRFHPVNLGDARHGGALRPSKAMNPLSHWNREITPDFEAVTSGLDTTTTAAAVFDDRVNAEECVKAVKEADLGLSINISKSIDGAEQC